MLAHGNDGGGDQWRAVASTSEQAITGRGRLVDPVYIAQFELVTPQIVVVELRGDVDLIFGHVFIHNIIRQAAADTQPLALANGVKNCAVVLTDDVAGLPVDDVAGFSLDVLGKKVADADLADKANALRILFVSGDQTERRGLPTDV